jgi:DNA-binding response OmpR family regulator
MRILLVEDEQTVREFFTALLRQWNAEVIAAASAEDALATQSPRPPKVAKGITRC